MKEIPFICDVCGEAATEFDSWFNIASCDKHKDISPIERQKMGIVNFCRIKKEVNNQTKMENESSK